MTSAVDLWRAIDPDARFVSGTPRAMARPVRSVVRTRAAAPHLPPLDDAALLLVDAAVLPVASVTTLLDALAEAQLAPVAIILAGTRATPDAADAAVPVLISEQPPATLARVAAEYLADEPAALERLSTALRLACAEAALSDPQLATPAGLIAARVGRGVAISVDGELRALHPRPAGRALAARFAALHARLLGESSHGRRDPARQAREGLWLLERRIRPGAAAWLFDDVPFAAVDEVAADALTATARALLRRPAPTMVVTEPVSAAKPPATGSTGGRDPLRDTLVAVARSNGRVAPAARLLGVHRNTVLYRLRRARDERGLDPRRPQDALRILAELDQPRPRPTH
ncbi:MAG TPA: helix-turn-helix domain-containing protein [Candidatus Limnocylindria bacterium]|nr:helix-turn-helix domain-containing protein [Candidatus Limnocylindria bacterium]